MRMVMKMMIESDDGRLLTENEIFRIERGAQSRIAQTGLGLTLLEAKASLAATQQAFVATQAEEIVMRASHCPDCGIALKVKDCRQIVYRTLLGKLRLSSPRLIACQCQAGSSVRSFSPLANALRDRTHPELQYLTTRWASILSYGTCSTLLDEILPIGTAMSCSSVRNTVQRIGERMDAETSPPEGLQTVRHRINP